MKILRVNKSGYVQGGPERGMFDLYETFQKHNHQTYIFSTRSPKNVSFLDQKYFVEFSDLSNREGFSKDIRKAVRIFWNREARANLKKVVKEFQPDIIHYHSVFSHLAPSVFFVGKKIPKVMTLHDYKLFCPNRNFYTKDKICYQCLEKNSYWPCTKNKCIHDSLSQSILGTLEMTWNNKLLKVERLIDKFIAPTKFVYKKAIEAGISEEKLIHLPYSVNFSNTANVPSQSGNYFIYLGRLSKEKGIDVLIKSFNRISDIYPEWKLKIAGGGPELENLRQIANDKVEFTGWLKEDRIASLLKGAKAMIVPSLWPEVFGRIILEGYNFRTPVIATRVGGMQELIEDQITGLLFDAGSIDQLSQRLIWIIEHPDKVREMGDNAYNKIKNDYDSKERYQKLLEVYKKLILH